MRFVRMCVVVALLGYGHNIEAHPMDPLSPQEIKAASAILLKNGLLGEGWFLQELAIKVPSKLDMMSQSLLKIERQAIAVLVSHKKNENLECVLDMGMKAIVSKRVISSGQPAIMETEMPMLEKIVRNDPRFSQAMAARGLYKLDEVHIEPWGVGDVHKVDVDKSHRLMRGLFYYRGQTKNQYARPIEGVSAIVDLTTQKIVEFADTEIKPLAKKEGDFFKSSQAQVSLATFAPVLPVQPSSSIKVNGHEISWKAWQFHVGVNYREGMVVSMLKFNDHGTTRPILYRGAISEMVVPYADPSKNWHWRAAFDQGEYSIGPSTHSLTPGVHVPHDAHLFDVNVSTSDGGHRTIPKGLAVFERDGGLLWSHMDYISGDIAAKRGRELVAFHMFTVGNYDYALQWVFKEDGVVEVTALLTGIISVKGSDSGTCERCKSKLATGTTRYLGGLEDDFGTVVDQNLVGITHQHFFNFRLDFAVDGVRNSVAEVSFEKVGDISKNPHGNLFALTKKLLATEGEGGRDANDSVGRKWLVYNPNKKDRLGHYPGYVIVPGPSAMPLQQDNSKVAEQAGFLKHHLWITKADPEHRYVAGTYPNQNPGEGVSHWASRNASIDNEDLVAWYTVGLTHLPCPEDWPVMPVTKAGFILKPMGFFTQNPTVTTSDDGIIARK